MGQDERSLAKFIDECSKEISINELPIFHIMPGRCFRKLLSNEPWMLTPSLCEYFQEELIYGSYGRPTYRVKDIYKGEGHGGAKSFPYYPVALVFTPGSIPDISAIYPFDTGGYKNHYYDEYFEDDDDDTLLNLLRLPSSTTSARCLIQRVYQSNNNYFRSNPVASPNEADGLDFEIRKYLSMITAAGETDFDDRCSVVELQFDHPIELEAKNVEAIIVPFTFEDDPALQEAATAWDAEMLTYVDIKISADGYQGVIYQKAWDFIKEKGWDN